MTQQRLNEFAANSGGPVEPEQIEEQAEPEECPHNNTRAMSPASPRLTPDGSPWANTRPIWCSDCKRVVRREPV